MKLDQIGQSVKRKEGPAKLTGAAKYIDDLHFDDLLYAVTIRSTIARGKIKSITYTNQDKIPWSEITVVTAKDIPGKNYVALILTDQPYLAETEINHHEEPILLLVHHDKYLLEEARRAVKIEYEELPAVFSIDDSKNKKHLIWGNDNTFRAYKIEKGNVDPVWDKAHLIVEDTYETGAQEQLYIETNGVVAEASKNGVTVWGSMQCPYYVHKALLPLFNIEPDKIRVIQAETGGGFGGKEEYPSIIAGHAALCAFKTGKKVKIIYDRSEDMAATTKRHPSQTKIKSALDKAGKLLAMDIEFLIDGGAYATLSAVVLSRGSIHAAGPYNCPNVRIQSKAFATNHPPHGAFRGFGAPQSIFALERHIDHLAQKAELDPVAFRKLNLLKEGETTATGQTHRDGVELTNLIDYGLEKSNYFKKIKEHQNTKHPYLKRGMGLAFFMHGSGFTGAGEKMLKSVAGVQALPSGKISVLAASTEIGQGTNTIFSQIAADSIGVDYETIEVAQPDTSKVPNSGPTVASRTCMIVGKLVENACIALRDKLIKENFLQPQYSDSDFRSAVKNYVEKHGSLIQYAEYEQPSDIVWDDDKHQGDAYGAFAWALYVAEVEVNLKTYETKVLDFMALQEVGKVINPVLAAGQIEGGVAQGIGYALYENCVYKDGKLLNSQMTNYIMPTANDLPEIKAIFMEVPYNRGPAGSKGIGELPMDGPGPAIINAVENATGVSIHKIPMTPEVYFNATQKH